MSQIKRKERASFLMAVPVTVDWSALAVPDAIVRVDGDVFDQRREYHYADEPPIARIITWDGSRLKLYFQLLL